MPNPNASYGRAVLDAVASQIPAFGRVFVVLSSTDSANEVYQSFPNIFTTDDDGKVRFFNTFESAYEAAQSNNNDVICLDAHTTHAVSDMVTFSKSRVHVLGFDGGGRLVQQGAKIQLSGNVASAAVVKVTGVCNSFRNIKFIQSSTNGAALNVLQLGGEGTYMENCSAVFGVANNLGSTSATEVAMGEDSGTFVNCSWGTDVLLTSAARAVMTLQVVTGGQSADGAKSNRFIDNEYVIMSSSANALAIKLASTSSAKFLNEWVDARFLAVINSTNVAIAITNAIASAAGFVEGTLAFIRPNTINFTNGCAGVTDNVRIAGAPVFTANAWEGGTPS